MNNSLKKKVDYSVALIRKAEKTAITMNGTYYLAFSGGKDSLCIYHLAKMDGVKFEAHYNLTTLDPPELVQFIRNYYPDVIIDRPQYSFLALIEKKGFLPTSKHRYCCAELKERYGAGYMCIIGIRKAESKARKQRSEFEYSEHHYSRKKRGTGYKGSFDNWDRNQELSIECMGGKDKVLLSPIIEWTDDDVWGFIHYYKLNYCSLYDEGFTRIGCIMCPKTSVKNVQREAARFPKYRQAIVRVVNRLMINTHKFDTIKNRYPEVTAEDIVFAWSHKLSLGRYCADKYLQQTFCTMTEIIENKPAERR